MHEQIILTITVTVFFCLFLSLSTRILIVKDSWRTITDEWIWSWTMETDELQYISGYKRFNFQRSLWVSIYHVPACCFRLKIFEYENSGVKSISFEGQYTIGYSKCHPLLLSRLFVLHASSAKLLVLYIYVISTWILNVMNQ